jgi:hypothetical protein
MLLALQFAAKLQRSIKQHPLRELHIEQVSRQLGCLCQARHAVGRAEHEVSSIYRTCAEHGHMSSMSFAPQMEGDAVEAVIADAEQLAGMLQPMYKELQVSSTPIICSNTCCLGSSKQPYGGMHTTPMPAVVSVLV